MTKDMTTTTTNALATQPEIYEDGLEALDAGDLIIPRLSINQPTTPDIELEQAGKFFINLTGDCLDSMNVVLIKLTKSRILFPEKYKRDNDPLCRSHDFKYPANDIQGAEPMAASCGLLADGKTHVCPYANWTAADPPRCQETWNLLVVDLDSYMPMWFSVKSTGLKPLRKIISAISIISKAKRVPMWGLQFSMALQRVVADSGTYYIPVFAGPIALEDAEKEAMTAIRQQLVNVEAKDSAEPVMDDMSAPSVSKEDEPF